MHTGIRFQVFLSNTNNMFTVKRFQSVLLIRIILNRSLWSIDVTLICTTIPGQSWPGSNGNEGVRHTPLSTWAGASA